MRQLFFIPLLIALFSCSSLPHDQVETVSFAGKVSYGSHSRQYYDIYRPESSAPNAPVVVFFHGGNWTFFNPGIHRFVGQGLADRGVTTIIAGFRVAPQGAYPRFMQDAAAALSSVYEREGRGRPIFAMGHSSGAHIAMLALSNPDFLAVHGRSLCDFRGVVGISGPYEFSRYRVLGSRMIFPLENYVEIFPAIYLEHDGPPALLLHGRRDSTVPVNQSITQANRMREAGRWADVKVYDNLGHIDVLQRLSLVSQDQNPEVIQDIMEFITHESARSRTNCG